MAKIILDTDSELHYKGFTFNGMDDHIVLYDGEKEFDRIIRKVRKFLKVGDTSILGEAYLLKFRRKGSEVTHERLDPLHEFPIQVKTSNLEHLEVFWRSKEFEYCFELQVSPRYTEYTVDITYTWLAHRDPREVTA